jgi:hypothetical protein
VLSFDLDFERFSRDLTTSATALNVAVNELELRYLEFPIDEGVRKMFDQFRHLVGVFHGREDLCVTVVFGSFSRVEFWVGVGEPSRRAHVNLVEAKSVVLHVHVVLIKRFPDKLLEFIDRFVAANFDHNQDVTHTRIANGGVELRVKRRFVNREVVKIDDMTANIAKFNVFNAINKTTENRMKNLRSFRDRITIIERKIKSDVVGI